MRSITVYLTPTCPYCKDLKAYFDAQQIRYTEVDLTTSEEARNMLMKKIDTLAVPVVDIDGTIIVGFDLPNIEAALDGRSVS